MVKAEVGVDVGVGVGVGVGAGVGGGVGGGVGVVAGAPHWQPVTTTIKDRRQIPIVHIVTFRMTMYLFSIRIYIGHLG